MLIKKEIKLISKKKEVVLNENIKASKVRLIDYDGKQHGIVSIDEALEKALSEGFDLIELNSDSNPTVCKIIDYGKYKYEQQRQKKLNKKKQHIIHVKEIRLRPNTGKHDLLTKLTKPIRLKKTPSIIIIGRTEWVSIERWCPIEINKSRSGMPPSPSPLQQTRPIRSSLPVRQQRSNRSN